MTTEKTKKNETKFVCEFCHFETCKKTDYSRHILTMKHKNNILTTDNNKKNEKKYECECGKEYNDRAGLWRHKKKCMKETIIEEKNTSESVDIFDKNLILTLIQQNNELQKQMFEVIKNGTNNNNNNNNTTNSHNKSFNLNFFLNETCKDAMNIMDFVDSIKLQLSDLEKVGKIGFIEGISNIIVKNLNSLDETKRPVHCTDSKREVMYVKDEDKWEKENETKVKLRKAIKHVAHKNSKMLSEFRVKNPDCLKSTSKVSDQYNKLVFEALGGKGDNDLEKEDKIIKNIAKEVTIDSKA
jgi:hypothetical protein